MGATEHQQGQNKMMPVKPSEFAGHMPTRPLSSKTPASKYLSSRQYVEELAVCCTKRFMGVWPETTQAEPSWGSRVW